ncbi:SLACS reverse transcriptase, putative, (fragment), partial [Trypanosoma vivax Y486]
MVREGSARGRTGPAAPKHGPQNGVRADARWHGALGVPGRMVDGSVIAEIVEAATRAVMQRMFDGAGQQVCGDGRRNYVSPQKASTPSFVRPMPGAFSGPANAQGQSGNTQGRDNRPLSGTKVKWTSNNQQKHVQQQQQQQQHKVTWAAVVAQKAPPQQRHRPVPWTPVSAARRDAQTQRRADPQVRVSEGNGAQARREQGPRTPAAQQGKGHRGAKAEEATKGHAATAASVAHAQKTPPPFAEDEVDLALSRNIAQLLYQAECEKIEVAQRAINVKTRWWNTMAHGRDLHHCPACAFAHKQEDAVLRHCREQHAAEGKLYPYTLACAHGVQQCGPSCALASVLAVVSHFPEEATFSRELRDTYAAPSRAATAHIVEACGLQLPVGPATALEEVVAREPVLRELFQDRHVAIRKCAVCGAAEVLHGEGGNFQTVSGGMVALLPPQRAPVHLDADAVMACVKSTQVDHTISCTGRAKGRQHAPAPVATEQSRVFSEAVAVEIGMWGDDPVGVDQIPMELVLPHENGSATFGIAGVVAATSRTHVAAFVPGASQHGAWDMYDGMVHRVVPNGPEPKTVVLLIYRRRRDEDADMDGVECSVGFDDANEECAPEGAGAEEDLKHAQKRPRDALAQAMPPEMPRDKRGRRAFGSKRKRTRGTPNATGSDMDEEDGETSMVELLRLVGEHLAQTHDGDETASLPHDPPASAENEEAAPQSEAGAEVDASTPNGDETASLPHDPPASAENEEAAPQSVAMAEVRAMETGVQEAASETQDAVAETGSWSHVDQRLMPAVVRCPVANCDAEFEGFRRSEGIKSHMNGRHTEADRRSLTNEAMIPQGLVRCEVCGHVHGASVRARRAHVSACGDYVPRKAAMARARDNYRHETETSSAMQAAVQPEQEPVRTLPRAMREVCVGQGGENDPTTDPWMQERVATKRYLHKKEWAAWLEVCRPAFLGYGASSQAERCRRQLVIMDLVRTHLAMGRGEAQRRRDAVAGQAARAAGARNGIPQDEGAQDEGVQDEDAQARRTAARVEMLCMLNAAGRAARMLTRDGEDLVRSSAAEVVREVDGLYPQEDVSTFPQPPL